LAAIAYAAAPLKHARVRAVAPAEIRPAARDALDRLKFAQDRMAVVLSLWFEQPTRQCAIGVRYAEDAGRELDPAFAPSPPREAGARALQARLQSAGFAFAAAAQGRLEPKTIRRAA
jgi:hypothetical protein